jgi:hypothetical protein
VPAHPSPKNPLALGLLLALMLLVPVGGYFLVRTLLPGEPALATSTPPPSPPPPRPVEPVPEPADVTPEIHGRILDANGDPAGGAAVRLVSPSPPYAVLRESHADGSGGFSFDHLRKGKVRVVADRDPDGVVSSAELRAAEGQSLEVTLVLSLANAVRGSVVDAEDHPVAGAALSVEGVPWTVRSATSDEAGAFRMTTVPREASALVAVARGYKTARVVLPHTDDPTEQAERIVRIKLVPAAPIAGVVHAPDDTPIRARVVACEGQPSEIRTTSADDGSFELAPSAIGCDVVAEHDEYAPSDASSVAEGRRVSLRLKPGGVVEGVVVDERNAPVPSFHVGIESFTAARAGGGFRSGGAHPVEDARGAFRWEKLAPGSYVFTATAAGKPPARSDAIEVSGGATTRGVRIVLTRGGVVIGHVYDERRAPLSGTDLRFDAVSSAVDSTAEARTDDSGGYRLEGAPPGPFTLRVQKDGFRLKLLSGLRIDSSGVLTLDVVLTSFDGGPGLEYAGIGATLQQTPDGIVFGALFPGEPAERAGLKAGDRIQSIDGEDTSAMSVADALQRLRGEAKTPVGVSVVRQGGETVDLVINRAAIVH